MNERNKRLFLGLLTFSVILAFSIYVAFFRFR